MLLSMYVLCYARVAHTILQREAPQERSACRAVYLRRNPNPNSSSSVFFSLFVRGALFFLSPLCIVTTMLLLDSSSITSAHQSLYSHYSPRILRLSLKNCTVSTSSSSPSSISSPIVSLRCGVPMAAIFSSSTSSDSQEDKQTLTGVNFQPFVEIRDHIFMVPSSSSVSLARQNFSESCESALNEQIKYDLSLRSLLR